MSSTRALNKWPCQATCKAWLLVVSSTRALNEWPCPAACETLLLVRVSSKALNEWPCQATCKACFWITFFCICEFSVMFFSPRAGPVRLKRWAGGMKHCLPGWAGERVNYLVLPKVETPVLSSFQISCLLFPNPVLAQEGYKSYSRCFMFTDVSPVRTSMTPWLGVVNQPVSQRLGGPSCKIRPGRSVRTAMWFPWMQVAERWHALAAWNGSWIFNVADDRFSVFLGLYKWIYIYIYIHIRI